MCKNRIQAHGLPFLFLLCVSCDTEFGFKLVEVTGLFFPLMLKHSVRC